MHYRIINAYVGQCVRDQVITDPFLVLCFKHLKQ